VSLPGWSERASISQLRAREALRLTQCKCKANEASFPVLQEILRAFQALRMTWDRFWVLPGYKPALSALSPENFCSVYFFAFHREIASGTKRSSARQAQDNDAYWPSMKETASRGQGSPHRKALTRTQKKPGVFLMLQHLLAPFGLISFANLFIQR
jgi:hypothetical protein